MQDKRNSIPNFAWLRYLIGSSREERLEFKIYFFFCSTIVIASLVSLAINLFQHIFLNEDQRAAIFSCIMLTSVGFAFHHVGRRFENPEKPAALLIIVAATLIGLNWHTNQGIEGSLPLWFAPLFIIAAATMKGRLLASVAIYLTAVIAISVGVEWRLPHRMIAYGSPEAQLFDVGAVLLLTTLICFSVTLFLIFAYRQERALAITLEREKLKSENLLDAAILEKNQLQSLLPMCAWCKKIETTDGSWASFERYLSEQKKTDVTHGICPSCLIEEKKGV